jgi:hypothetical protein
MHVVKCGHCGARVRVNAWREPLSYAEREAEDGRQKLVIIGGDGLLHECIIDEKKAFRARLPLPQQLATRREDVSTRYRAHRTNKAIDGS